MSLRYRNSIKIAPGVKFNINKKSVGFTVGTKGVHYTKNSNGRATTSVNLPVKGLYYSNVTNTTQKNCSNSFNDVYSSSITADREFISSAPTPELISAKSKSILLLLCIFGGWFGMHYFYSGRIGKGLLYLFTVGLCCFGWIYDIFVIFSGKFRDSSGAYIRNN